MRSPRRRSSAFPATLHGARAGPPRPRGAAANVAGQGYPRAADEAGLAAWAEAQGAVVVLLVRPGEYIFPGAAAGRAWPARARGAEAEAAIRPAFSLGGPPGGAQDLEFAVRQLWRWRCGRFRPDQ